MAVAPGTCEGFRPPLLPTAQCRVTQRRPREGLTWWGRTQWELRFGYRVPGSSVY